MLTLLSTKQAAFKVGSLFPEIECGELLLDLSRWKTKCWKEVSEASLS